MRAAKAKWFSLGRRRSLSSIPVSFGVLNPNTSAQPRLFHSRDLPFRVSFAPCQRGKKGVAMFAPNLNSSPPSLRGLILRITTLSDAEGKERKERKAGRGGRMEKSVRVDFVFRSNFCKGEIPSPPHPALVSGKSKATYKREKRNLSSRYRIALSFAPRRQIQFEFSSFSSFSSSRPRCISMHFEATRLHATISSSSPSSLPFNLFYFIRHSRHEQGRIPVRGSTRPINSCKTCTHR